MRAVCVWTFGLGLVLASAGCTEGKEYAQAVAVLVDTSGTYADQKADVVNITKRALIPRMSPGDSLFFITIDGQSYEKQNLHASLKLDMRPSKANAQKAAFAKSLDDFSKSKKGSRYTDIMGAMMLAVEYLKETAAGSQNMVIFSDMKQELPRGVKRELDPTEFEGMSLAAMNVKKLNEDNVNPQIFRKRLARWKERVLKSGAKEWRVALDAEKLVEYLDDQR